AEKAKVQVRNREKNLKGDMILKVEVHEPNKPGEIRSWGRVRDGEGMEELASGRLIAGAAWYAAIHYAQPPLDPVRLPDLLKEWAVQMAKAEVENWQVTFYVQRQREKGGEEFEPEPRVVELKWDNDWQFDKIQPFPTSSTSPQAIPELGLAYQVMT